MNRETQSLLNHVDQELNPGSMNIQKWNEYIRRLPQVYNNDITFRLLFDWHWDLNLQNGRAGFRSPKLNTELPIYAKQVNLIIAMGIHIYGLEHQYQELIKYHARCDLRGKSLLEIGGSLPNDLLFETIGVDSYINIESPDYLELDSQVITQTSKHGDHEQRKTIFCNAEEVHKKVSNNSIDSIFSVACFEHIYDLAQALESCNSCSKKGGSLYSFFAPIYSHLRDGDHGLIPEHKKFQEKPIGFHLLSPEDQRKKLIEKGITEPQEIQNLLGEINFNRLVNRLLYEDYERICTESSYAVLEFHRQEELNISKIFKTQLKAIRSSNPRVSNMMASGFRVHLLKI